MESSQKISNWVSAGASALSAGWNFINGLFGSAKQEAMNREQMQFAHDEAQLQRDWQEKMFNRENEYEAEYNSPAHQLALMKEAGLNPNSFDAGIVPASSSVGSGASAAQPPMGVNPYDKVSQSLLQSSQIALANAQARNLNANTERTEKLLPGEIKAQGVTLNLGEANVEFTKVQKEELESKLAVNAASIRNLDEQTRSLVQSRGLMDLNIKEKEVFLKEFEERLHNELLQQKSKLRLDDATIKQIVSQIALNASQIDVNNASITNMYDVHLLNGVELGYKDKMLKVAYNSQAQQYNLSVLESGIRKRNLKARNDMSTDYQMFVNLGLDELELLTGIVGNVFGQIPQYMHSK